MAAFLLLDVLFILLAVAGLAGWCVDSRDSRFSLWPLHRGDPDDRPQRDANGPLHQASRGIRLDIPRVASSGPSITKAALSATTQGSRAIDPSPGTSDEEHRHLLRGESLTRQPAPEGGPVTPSLLAQRRLDLHNTTINFAAVDSRYHPRRQRPGVSAAHSIPRPPRRALTAPPARRQKGTHDHSVPTQ
jgi:hypothetical protein